MTQKRAALGLNANDAMNFFLIQGARMIKRLICFIWGHNLNFDEIRVHQTCYLISHSHVRVDKAFCNRCNKFICLEK